MSIPTAIFLAAAGGFLYHFYFIPPFLPINSGGDSFLYLAPGQRMYQGEMIYKDVFEFLPPGTALVNFFMFKLFGLRPWIPNLLSLALGLGLAWVGVAISRKLMRPSLALLPSAFFLVYSTRAYLYDPTHHWYSELAVLAGIAVLLESRTPTRIAIVGLLCGIATSFTQTRGPAAIVGFGLFLWWESQQRHEGFRTLLKKESLLLGSSVGTFLIINAYFIWKAGFARYFWSTVVFVFKYYPKEADANTFRVFDAVIPEYVTLWAFLSALAHSIVLYAFIPFVFVLFFICYWRRSTVRLKDQWERPMLVAIVGCLMLLSIAPAPNDVRMVTCMLPALVLFFWLLDSPGKLAKTVIVGLIAGCIAVAIRQVVILSPHPAGIIETPQDRFAMTDPIAFQVYDWVHQHTRPNDYLFQTANTDIYFYLNLRNPTPLSVIKSNGYTTTEQVGDVIHGLEQHHDRYILSGAWADDSANLPKWESPSEYHLGPLEDYIHRNFRIVIVFPNQDEIWERVKE